MGGGLHKLANILYNFLPVTVLVWIHGVSYQLSIQNMSCVSIYVSKVYDRAELYRLYLVSSRCARKSRLQGIESRNSSKTYDIKNIINRFKR